MTNKEIVDANLELLRQCVDCQFATVEDKQFKEDFFHDLIIILYSYDNDKLVDANEGNHLNALVTRIIQNNIWSKTSPYYKEYYKFQNKTDNIKRIIEEEDGGD